MDASGDTPDIGNGDGGRPAGLGKVLGKAFAGLATGDAEPAEGKVANTHS